jgi:hypothetical protein
MSRLTPYGAGRVRAWLDDANRELALSLAHATEGRDKADKFDPERLRFSIHQAQTHILEATEALKMAWRALEHEEQTIPPLDPT